MNISKKEIEEQGEDQLYLDSSGPDVSSLKNCYDETIADLGFFFTDSQQNWKDRRNKWSGKTSDLRKSGADAFPWEGASDTEAHVISDRINSLAAIFMNALDRANVRAYPTEYGDASRARVVSSFLKWMIVSYIKDFRRNMERAANHILEKGIAITYVGWLRQQTSYLQKLSLEEIQAMFPELIPLIMEKEDDKIIQLLASGNSGISPKRAKKALNELRNTGFCEIPVSRVTVDAPMVQTLAPDEDVFFPAFTIDYKDAPYCFRRTYMTKQQILANVKGLGWDEEWAHEVVEMNGTSNQYLGSTLSTQNLRAETVSTDELIEVVHAYQKLIDPEDGSIGIYCTVFCPQYVPEEGSDSPKYAKFELLNGYDNFPFVVTKLSEENGRLYDVAALPELLRGMQWAVKAERDARIDRNSWANMPPLIHAVGYPPTDWRPGGMVPVRRPGEIQFAPYPQYNVGSVEIEKTMLELADAVCGLSIENPLAVQKQQYLVSKFLRHTIDVVSMAYRAFERFGPNEVWFRVTGQPEPVKFEKGNGDEKFDININYDVLNNDPETLEKRIQLMQTLFQFDSGGRINVNAWLDSVMGMIDPIAADAILQPQEAAQQEVVKNVTDDLTKIYSGIELGARPNGAQIALQVIQSWMQQPDIAQAMQTNEALQKRVETYAKQYQFQMMQAQNAQTGRIGTAPAQFQGTNNQV